MNTYLIPINENGNHYIKKIVAKSESDAEDKLFRYLYDKYEDLEGEDLDEIKFQLFDLGIDLGQIYDLEEFT